MDPVEIKGRDEGSIPSSPLSVLVLRWTQPHGRKTRQGEQAEGEEVLVHALVSKLSQIFSRHVD